MDVYLEVCDHNEHYNKFILPFLAITMGPLGIFLSKCIVGNKHQRLYKLIYDCILSPENHGMPSAVRQQGEAGPGWNAPSRRAVPPQRLRVRPPEHQARAGLPSNCGGFWYRIMTMVRGKKSFYQDDNKFNS